MNKQKDYTKHIMALPILILICLLIIPLSTSILGKDIKLQTIPYDPRDLFRGDYVILNYEISQIPSEKLTQEITKDLEEYSRKFNKLYVVLKEENGIHIIDYVTSKKPKNKLYIITENVYVSKDNNVHGNYPSIETYFVEENTGLELEKMSREGNLIAEIKVFKGNMVLKNIYPKE